jgi:glutamate N-acetyltransferase/amino-acid N-acetyltransferase
MKKSPLAPHSFPAIGPVEGVRLAAVASALRYKGRDDLLLAELAAGTVAAGLFTMSKTAAPSVLWSREVLEKAAKGRPFGLVVNAGNANAFTGKAGERAVREIAGEAAKLIGTDAGNVFVAQTGVIGEPLDTAKVTAALPAAASSLGVRHWHSAAEAIRTTDTFAKGASAQAEIGGTTVHIAGIAKGSGMIEPNMATMLAFVFTDAAIAPAALHRLLAAANEKSFNAITVDSDTSTSDTLLLFATGKAGHAPVTDAADAALDDFRAALEGVLGNLARQIVRDGEGATKFVTVTVTGAESDEAAKIVAKSIANSPLVKTAIAGEDANWGRIVAAVGKAGPAVDVDKLVIRFGGVVVTQDGARVKDYDESKLDAHLKGQEIAIDVDLGLGKGAATVWTCDLTHGYIDINADYRS